MNHVEAWNELRKWAVCYVEVLDMMDALNPQERKPSSPPESPQQPVCPCSRCDGIEARLALLEAALGERGEAKAERGTSEDSEEPQEYRLLNVGEVIQEGDEWWVEGEWREVRFTGLQKLVSDPCRRPIKKEESK